MSPVEEECTHLCLTCACLDHSYISNSCCHSCETQRCSFGSQTKLGHAVPFGNTERLKEGLKSQTGKYLGPGSYPTMSSMGGQQLSQRKNPVTHPFSKAPKFGKSQNPGKKGSFSDPTPPLTAFGQQARSDKKSEPRVGFSKGTRAQAARMTRCMSDMDKMSTRLPPVRLPQPTLPLERRVISYSGSIAGK